MIRILMISAFLFSMAGCNTQSKKENSREEVGIELTPKWSQEAIWYQIFVERFRNGDTSNDPRKIDIFGADPEYIPENWEVTDWGHDWYQSEPWFETSEGTNFYHIIQQRRYGGDLQGVLDKIDYLDSLGINAIYFNPLNDSPSLHKYDARNWRHIDRNFGPDPDLDIQLISEEIPDDPQTWIFTAADSMFLNLIKEFHDRDIRVIMDYSWNHTGTQFWAIDSLRKYGRSSKYVDWFNVESFDDPSTQEDEFKYEGWAGYRFMPVVKKAILPEDDHQMPYEGNLVSESLKTHIFNISARWLDPNGDGDFTDGVDGFRLDVAGEVPIGFWKDYRKFVKGVNPDAYLLGEIWWLEWPEKLLSPRVFLEGDQFDAIMNYRWYRIARGFFAQADPQLLPSEFIEGIKNINREFDPSVLRSMMNMSASHDSPRLSTSFYNKNLYKFNVKPLDDPAYKTNKPDKETWKQVKLFLLTQFTFVGSPQIWNGDEMGMWGADDPDDRKPLIWPDLEFEFEEAHIVEPLKRQADTILFDKSLYDYYKKLIEIRKSNQELVYGDLDFIYHDDAKMSLAYSRSYNESQIIIAVNRSDISQKIKLKVEAGRYKNIWTQETIDTSGNILEIDLQSVSGIILKRQD